ncbi:MAG: Tol-Pal system protein TolB, partial [Aliifodinibius sp.]|nr:Tol-Pal system protein TolB [Fodinibius sp.]NIV14385.1 Tol-Pal system protein TolB [Fodinibius sp.]NIY28205.1 Tol-Pal system protein TolB [Fodinibius sp.]
MHSGHLIGFVDWSPDGNKLVFYSWHDGDADIYVYDFVTNQINRLTENNTTDWAPVWSPTGDWIA